MDSKSKLLNVGLAVALLVAVGVGFWFWSQKRAQESAESAVPGIIEVEDGLGAEVFNKTNNPLSNELPETNPFNVDTNPFK